jgi:hypothetical protein
MKGGVEFGSYFDHVSDWYTQAIRGGVDGGADQNVLFLYYEDMKADLPSAVAQIARFVGRDDVADDAEKVAEIAGR